MSLKDWEKNGCLKPHKTSKEEIQNLLKIIERDLNDCRTESISPDWRFAIAYNAALQCCTILLYCQGYMPARGQGAHYRTIQSLALTLGSDFKETVIYLNACRVKRNVSDYESTGTISESEVEELIESVEEFFGDIKNWLNESFPDYL